MLIKKNNIFKAQVTISIFLYLTLILGFFSNEDSLGGAIHDYNFHLPIIFSFKNNISDSLSIYGSDEMIARNSPFFYIIFGFIYKFLENVNILRFINSHVIILVIIFFYKALKIKFYAVEKEKLYLISIILFLSPTLRSLSIWPYPLMYAILFFTISIYFFLKFEKQKNNNYKYALLNIFFLALSSYFTPNFCVFSIFFFFKFFKKYEFSNKTYLLILFNSLLALPAIFFLIKKKFFFFNYDVASITFLDKINFANKIIIISTIIFFHLLPFLLICIKKVNLSKSKFIAIIIIFFVSIIFFNFPKEYNSGGGILYQISFFLIKNNFLLFFIFLFSLIYLNEITQKSYYNQLLIILLILYNPQFSIYHKYFDCIVLLIFLLLFNGTLNTNYFKYKNIFYLYIFQIFFLILSLSKSLIYNIKIL
jgi:hypothetical protein